MAPEFVTILLSALQATGQGIDLLEQVVSGTAAEPEETGGELGQSRPVPPLEALSGLPVSSSSKPDPGSDLPEISPLRPMPWPKLPSGQLLRNDRVLASEQRRLQVQAEILALVTQSQPEDTPPAPVSGAPSVGRSVPPDSFRRYAFGGGDVGEIGVSPAEMSGFRETSRRRSRLAPNQQVRFDGGVETNYIASDALQAILKLVDESVARHFGAMNAR